MLKAISEYVVRLTDLFEAEGRRLRDNSVKVGVGLVLLLGAVALGVLAFALALYAVHTGLAPSIGPAWSLAVVALLCLGGAGGLAWAAKMSLR